MNDNIISTGYNGTRWLLIDQTTQRSIRQGDMRPDFRGSRSIIEGGKAPHKPSSTGRVWADGREFFPAVFNCVWVKV